VGVREPPSVSLRSGEARPFPVLSCASEFAPDPRRGPAGPAHQSDRRRFGSRGRHRTSSLGLLTTGCETGDGQFGSADQPWILVPTAGQFDCFPGPRIRGLVAGGRSSWERLAEIVVGGGRIGSTGRLAAHGGACGSAVCGESPPGNRRRFGTGKEMTGRCRRLRVAETSARWVAGWVRPRASETPAICGRLSVRQIVRQQVRGCVDVHGRPGFFARIRTAGRAFPFGGFHVKRGCWRMLSIRVGNGSTIHCWRRGAAAESWNAHGCRPSGR